MSYVIRRNENFKNNRPAYVNQPGAEKSYTMSKEKANRFTTYEAAKEACCGNEYPVEV